MRIAKGSKLQPIFAFHCKAVKHWFWVATSLWPFCRAHFIVGVCVTGGRASSGRACARSTKPFPPPVERRHSWSRSLCLFMIWGCGGIKAGRMKAPELPVSSCFPQRRHFFFSPKDDASFQGVFNLQTVSSVYFTTVKCVPSRSYLSLLKLNLSFSTVLVATQKNKCDLWSPFNEVQRPINLCHWSFIRFACFISFMKNFRCQKFIEHTINLTI